MNTKAMKTVIMFMLGILSLSCFSLLFVSVLNVLEFKNIGLQPQASNVYIFPSLDTDEDDALEDLEDNYDDYTDFVINSVGGWRYFAASTIYNFTYEDKNIKLTSDIDLSKYSMDDNYGGLYMGNFYGTLDGNGKTIKNMSIIVSAGSTVGSICLRNHGTIQNLEVKSFDAYLDSGSSSNTWYGFIAGENYGTIQNCIINSGTIKSRRKVDNAYVGFVAYKNNGTIKNIITRGTIKLTTYAEKNCGLTYGKFAKAGSSDVENSIFAATVNISYASGYESGKGHEIKESSEVSESYETSFTSAYDWLDDTSTSCTGSSAWFKYRSTSYGYGGNSSYPVYLRAFVNFKNIEFSATNGGKVNGNTSYNIIVPSDYSTATTSGKTKSIYGYSITATHDDELFDFDSWSGNTAKFYQKYIYLEFKSVTCNGENISPSNSNGKINYNSGNPNISVYFDKVALKITYTYNCDNAEYTTSYNVNLESLKAYSYKNTTKTVTSRLITITPNLSIKIYNIEFC